MEVAMRYYRIPPVAIVALLYLLITGCGGGTPVTPEGSILPENLTNSTQAEFTVSNPHMIWDMGWVMIDPTNHSWEIIPARGLSIHVNVRKFLEDGPCTTCFKITSFDQNPDETYSVGIKITHPWTGLDQFTGFDVRAIAMWNGSETWDASGLVTQAPDSTDGYVLNPDGYTTIFNPIDFAPGSSAPLFEYSKGKFGTPVYPSSTLNPYIDYWTDEVRHFFRAGQYVTRTWEIEMPDTVPLVFGYAIDASWMQPDGAPPYEIPDDFTQHANKPEPWQLEIEQPDPVDVLPGEEVDILVNTWDWQENPAIAWIECPDLWEGKKYSDIVANNFTYFIFYVPVSNELEAPPGTYRALVGVEDNQSSPPPWDYTTYTFFDIEVEAVVNQAPVAAAEADTYSVYTGENINFTSLSTDPNGQDDIELYRWDFENDGTWDSSDVNPQWSYDEPGTYMVDHFVRDYGGLEDDLEPDDLLEIEVIDKCCEASPVAVISGNQPIITGEILTLTSDSYDIGGEECIAEEAWDLDNDGFYEEIGPEVSVDWDTIGDYPVSLKVTDVCGLSDETSVNIDVHLGVTQPEDQTYREIGLKYSYVSADYEPDHADFAVDLANPAGPWDFTLLTLSDIGNYRAILDPEHPETSTWNDEIVGDFDHFYKTEGIYNFAEGSVYVAEDYSTDPDTLDWIALHENENIGTVNLSPVMTQDYPYWIFSSDSYYYGFPPIFEFAYHLEGFGEGNVSVPWNSLTNEPCVVVHYVVNISSPSLNGGASVYEWILDDGTVVAVVAAINEGTDINYDPETGEITGIATFNALNSIGPYD